MTRQTFRNLYRSARLAYAEKGECCDLLIRMERIIAWRAATGKSL
jgi:hypothetical protein